MCCFPHWNMIWAGGKKLHMVAVTSNRSVMGPGVSQGGLVVADGIPI